MDGFVIYREIADKIELLSDAQAGELLKMALAFAFDGEIVHTDDLAVNIVFTDMKRDIFRAAEKYQRICERNRENGAKGGRPKTQESPEEPKETQWDNLETQENQKNPNTEHRESESLRSSHSGRREGLRMGKRVQDRRGTLRRLLHQ
ncbi:MAG: hypothetical protein II008_03185 [Oscillospiraceae bacterium]|nr:hypothetical protein [Oscillospiraceae bacterium]